jgi:hypothetical protein
MRANAFGILGCGNPKLETRNAEIGTTRIFAHETHEKHESEMERLPAYRAKRHQPSARMNANRNLRRGAASCAPSSGKGVVKRRPYNGKTLTANYSDGCGCGSAAINYTDPIGRKKAQRGIRSSDRNLSRAYRRDAGYSSHSRFLCLFVAKNSGRARLCVASELHRVFAPGDFFQLLLGIDLHGAPGDVGVGRQTQDHLGRTRL